MSSNFIDLLESVKQEAEQEWGRWQREYDELNEFASRMAADKKRLTEQNIKLIERIRELEELYESDICLQRFTFRTQKNPGVREGDTPI